MTQHLTRTLPSDLITPVSAYLRLRAELGAPSFLLESVDRGQVGRYSFLGAGLSTVDSLDEAAAYAAARARPDGDLPPFAGGAVGFIGYDWVTELEPVELPPAHPDDPPLPRMRFMLTDAVVAFDHVLRVVTVTGEAAAVERILAALETTATVEASGPMAPGEPVAEIPHDRYLQIVGAAKEHIAAGDAFQILPSQRVRRPTQASAFALYRALRAVNPSPYMSLLDFGGFQLIGSSPETHVRLGADGECELRPIAGTRPRGRDRAEDEALEAELMASDKERAEHTMLLDLARNDLSRVCAPGSVRIQQLMDVERFSHVMHIVSRVLGQIAPPHDAAALLRATFPAGTVSGAPKVRAMQIISELEGRRRGAYAGAIGYLGYGGDMDTCIAIRTLVLAEGIAYLQSGGGVVADSDPEGEYQEAMNKIAALAVAIDQAETGVYGP